jgi:hypothetical protein
MSRDADIDNIGEFMKGWRRMPPTRGRAPLQSSQLRSTIGSRLRESRGRHHLRETVVFKAGAGAQQGAVRGPESRFFLIFNHLASPEM